MEFHSERFLAFFAITFLACAILRKSRLKTLALVAAGFVFYASWNAKLAALVFGCALADYAFGLAIERAGEERTKNRLLATAIAFNLCLLFGFKYLGFAIGSLEGAASALGYSVHWRIPAPVLPIGISFFTFEAISYLTDVRSGRVPAERNPLRFLLFITFFPHLIAGPIVRARDFLPQIDRARRWDWQRIELGVRLFVIGLFKKLAIADSMALFSDPVFQNPGHYSSHAIRVAVVAYAIRIFCDFSGYSDMAIGCAHILGFKLGVNFRMPYLSLNVSEFWRRWHISLSSWLRDYLFIPLGGSRRSSARTALNLMVTMILGGLWHGAGFTFLAWGGLHGLFLVVHRGFRAVAGRSPALKVALDSAPGRVLRWACTFTCIACAWIPFRAATGHGALAMFRGLVIQQAGAEVARPLGPFYGLLALVIAGHAIGSMKRFTRAVTNRSPAPALGFGYALVAACALLLAPAENQAFIYFQF